MMTASVSQTFAVLLPWQTFDKRDQAQIHWILLLSQTDLYNTLCHYDFVGFGNIQKGRREPVQFFIDI